MQRGNLITLKSEELFRFSAPIDAVHARRQVGFYGMLHQDGSHAGPLPFRDDVKSYGLGATPFTGTFIAPVDGFYFFQVL
jgi:hypothetical protein